VRGVDELLADPRADGGTVILNTGDFARWVAREMAAQLAPDGVHVAHVFVDGESVPDDVPGEKRVDTARARLADSQPLSPPARGNPGVPQPGNESANLPQTTNPRRGYDLAVRTVHEQRRAGDHPGQRHRGRRERPHTRRQVPDTETYRTVRTNTDTRLAAVLRRVD
jgi:hypothetical protein